jgi:hypothetical protein
VTADEETFRPLREAVASLLQRAQAALTFSTQPDDIKRACDQLGELLRTWNMLDGHFGSSVRGMLDLMQRNCKHPGAQRGYNERDGNWMNPCPTCGKSE